MTFSSDEGAPPVRGFQPGKSLKKAAKTRVGEKFVQDWRTKKTEAQKAKVRV